MWFSTIKVFTVSPPQRAATAAAAAAPSFVSTLDSPNVALGLNLWPSYQPRADLQLRISGACGAAYRLSREHRGTRPARRIWMLVTRPGITRSLHVSDSDTNFAFGGWLSTRQIFDILQLIIYGFLRWNIQIFFWVDISCYFYISRLKIFLCHLVCSLASCAGLSTIHLLRET